MKRRLVIATLISATLLGTACEAAPPSTAAGAAIVAPTVGPIATIDAAALLAVSDEIAAAGAVLALEEQLRTAALRPDDVYTLTTVLGQTRHNEMRAGLARILSRTAASSHVAAIEPLANDLRTAESARTILAAIPGPEADAGLIRLLESSDHRIAAGAASTLGERRPQAAITPLVDLAEEGHPESASAALLALGRYDGSLVLDPLIVLESKVAPAAREAWATAMLSAAQSSSKGHLQLRRLVEGSDTPALRGAALIGLANSDADDARLIVAKLIAEPQNPLHGYALQALPWVASTELASQMAPLMEALPEASRAACLMGLSGVHSEAFATAAVHQLPTASPELRSAIVRYFMARDGVTALEVLLAVATIESGDTAIAAGTAIARLRDPAVNPRVIELIGLGNAANNARVAKPVYTDLAGTGAESIAPALLPALSSAAAARRAHEAVPVLLQQATSANRQARNAALSALGSLVETDEIASLLTLIEDSADAARRPAIDAASSAIRRLNPPGIAATVRQRFTASTDARLRGAWLALAARIGGPESLALLVECLGSDTQDLRRDALRSLGDWPGTDPLDPLLSAAATAPQPAERVLAARSVLSILEGLPADRDAELMPWLQRLSPLLTEAETRRRLLALVPRAASPDGYTLARGYLSDSEVRAEAALAAAQLGLVRHKDQPDQTVAELMALLSDLSGDDAARRGFLRTARQVLPVWAGESWTGDPFMGNWAGELTFKDVTHQVAAQVLAADHGYYRAQIIESLDKPHTIMAQLEGPSTGSTVSITGFDWVGTITPELMSAAIPGDETSHFSLTKHVKPSPLLGRKAPADAVVLFDGTSLDAWQGEGANGAVTWKIVDGAAEVAPKQGSIMTRRSFRDYELHLEFRSPYAPGNQHQFYGNSGVFIAMSYEVQVLNSFMMGTRIDDCGAIYGVKPADRNVCAPPLEWQSYDIVFRAPRVAADGSLQEAASITVVHNGVMIHDRVTLSRTSFENLPHPAEPRPILLQDHHNRVQYRNIWLRELTPEDDLDQAIGRITAKEH